MAKGKLLIWKGTGVIPGWPAADHEEADPLLYEEKLASGLYRTADDKEEGIVAEEARAAKALANAAAAREAKQKAREAREAAERAEQLSHEREQALAARLAAARAILKEVEDGED